MPPLRKVLVIDDELSIRESLDMFLREKGFSVQTAGTGREGLNVCALFRPQVVILDIRLPDESGLEILRRMTAEDPNVKVVMITAYHDMETTIDAMRRGAYDYIHKPLDVDELDRAVTRSFRIAEAEGAGPPLLGDDPQSFSPHCIVGRTPAMRSIFKTIGLLSKNRATVLIEGETGVGKELIARAIHKSSEYCDQPYVTVDCTTLVDNLLESELFGHERGAFTGAVETKKGRLELAADGTIFFDEIGDLPLALQSKLLRFLEYREFTRVGGTQLLRSKARIIGATNHNLDELALKGRFRSDLLFRFKVITIFVPPLRERVKDVPELVQFFLTRINKELGASVTTVEKEAMEALKNHPWPGNVRELKNVLTKAVLEARGAVLLEDEVKNILTSFCPDAPSTAAGLLSLDEVQKAHILRAMAETGGNLSAAARALGISRPTLRKHLKRFGLERARSSY